MTNLELTKHLERIVELEYFIFSKYNSLINIEIKGRLEHKDCSLSSEYNQVIKDILSSIERENSLFDRLSADEVASNSAIDFFNHFELRSEDAMSDLAINNENNYIIKRVIKILKAITQSFHDDKSMKDARTAQKDVDFNVDLALINIFIRDGQNVGSDKERILIESKYHYTFLNPDLEYTHLYGKFKACTPDLALDDKKDIYELITLVKATYYFNQLMLVKDEKSELINKLKALYLKAIEAIISFMTLEEKQAFGKNLLGKIDFKNASTIYNELLIIFELGEEFKPHKTI